MKREVLRMIQELPEDVTIDEILYILYTRLKMEEGLAELDQGSGVPHDQAIGRIAKWLN